MSEKKLCIICGEWFVPRSSLQKACSAECIKEKDSRRKRAWQSKNWKHRKEYMRRYQAEHKEELTRKAYIRLKKWRKKNKRRNLANQHEARFDGMWLKTMDKYIWQCVTCDKPAQLVHHKDEDTTNNSENNLIALCRACHCKLHKPHEFHKT
jgi:hypothetical protein